MKNVLRACLGSIVMMGLLAGCGSNDAAAPEEEVEKVEITSDTEKQESEDVQANKEENTVEDKTTEEKVTEEKAATAGDVANAIDFTEALDRNNPVPLGEYMKLSIYSAEARKYHTVYIKFNKITSESDDAAYVQKVIDENNAEGYDFEVIDRASLDLPDDIELNVIDYELVIPKEFPAPDYGLTGITTNFYAKDIVDGGTPSNNGSAVYLGLGASEALLTKGARERKFIPGNAYQLRSYYMMVKGYDDYVIQTNTYPDGNEGTSASDMKTAYFAIK